MNIWDAGTPKVFLIHMQTVVCTCKRKGLFSNYESVLKDKDIAIEEVNGFCEVIPKAKTAVGKKKGTNKEKDLNKPLKDTEESLKGVLTKLAVAREEI